MPIASVVIEQRAAQCQEAGRLVFLRSVAADLFLQIFFLNIAKFEVL
jgi:hypothetical protein